MNSPDSKIDYVERMTASVTHEFQNVLAIIKENTGLIGDCFRFGNIAGGDTGGILERSIESIEQQIKRGSTLSSCLNQFAHSYGHKKKGVNVYQSIETLIVISGRIFERKGITLSFSGDDTVFFDVVPMEFSHLTFRCLEILSELIPDGTDISITLGASQHESFLLAECIKDNTAIPVFSKEGNPDEFVFKEAESEFLDSGLSISNTESGFKINHVGS